MSNEGDVNAPPAAAAAAAAAETPTDDNKIVVTSHVEQDAYPYGESVDSWAMVSLKAPAYEPTERSAIDLVAVVDKSGSMSGEKMKLVKETMHFVVDQLKETDRLGIVSYDTMVYTDLGLTVMNAAGRKKAHASVKALRDGSSTNLCGGLERGLVLIEQLGVNKKDVSAVLMMTDGGANRGFTLPDDILRRMTPAGRRVGERPGSSFLPSFLRHSRPAQPPSQQQQVPEAVTETKKSEDDRYKVAAVVNTFGFGSDHNATLLEAISERGAGVYYYIDQNEKIPESFADCLGGLLSTVGQNVSLNFASVDGATLTKVHHRRADALTDAGTHCVVNLGDIQSEEGKDIVVEMKLPRLAEPRDDPTVVLTAELGYFNAITNVMETTTTTLRVRRPGVVSEECKRPNRQIDQQRNRVIAAAAMKLATTLADQNQLEEARKVIDQATSQVEGSFTKDDALSKALLADLKQSKLELRSESAYAQGGSNFMYMKAQSHAIQRSSATADTSYVTPRKAMMKAAAKKK
ncbi:uncharacterized protein [Oscarella lobularis]|uniref:uncharacterized protein isoform X2 n=1 Tax=Oscarella lobularis TaxID=121494 RepID=UPI003313F8A4